MRRPAKAGPTRRQTLKTDELMATALTVSSGATSSTMNACRAGMSKVLAIPNTSATTKTCQYWTTPVPVKNARARAQSIMVVWVAMTTQRRGSRSATTPATMERMRTGIVSAAQTLPVLILSIVAGEGLGRADDAQFERRPAQLEDQPGLGDRLHPHAGLGDQLAHHEEAEVAMTQGRGGLKKRNTERPQGSPPRFRRAWGRWRMRQWEKPRFRQDTGFFGIFGVRRPPSFPGPPVGYRPDIGPPPVAGPSETSRLSATLHPGIRWDAPQSVREAHRDAYLDGGHREARGGARRGHGAPSWRPPRAGWLPPT